MNYKIINFLDEIYDNCSHVSFLSIRHVLNKLYDDIESQEVAKEDLLNTIQDYSLLLLYLNDFAGVIYRRHNSSVKIIYDELCKHFELNTDNKFTFEHIIKKLQKQTPILLMSLTDEDIQIQTIENYCEKLDKLIASKYYNDNIKELEPNIKELQKNINFVKMALQIK